MSYPGGAPGGSSSNPQGNEAPPPPPGWQSTPQPPGPPPQPSGWQSPPQPSGWQSPPRPSGGADTGQGFQSSGWTSSLTSTAAVAGPAGLYYADIPNRAVAYIIDFIGLFVVFFIVNLVTNSVLGTPTIFGNLPSTGSILVGTIVNGIVSAAYFIYTWMNMRGTLGMKVLGMQVGHESDGRTLDMNQAVTRWAVLFGPYILLSLVGAFALSLGIITTLLGVAWFIVLLVTTAQSPTKQGIHDRYAHTMVVKAGNRMF